VQQVQRPEKRKEDKETFRTAGEERANELYHRPFCKYEGKGRTF
jgi:hypothetical protein